MTGLDHLGQLNGSLAEVCPLALLSLPYPPPTELTPPVLFKIFFSPSHPRSGGPPELRFSPLSLFLPPILPSPAGACCSGSSSSCFPLCNTLLYLDNRDRISAPLVFPNHHTPPSHQLPNHLNSRQPHTSPVCHYVSRLPSARQPHGLWDAGGHGARLLPPGPPARFFLRSMPAH